MCNKAIKRLSWRFSQQKAFKPNENDINALNDVIKHLNESDKKQINDNRLFAKLYIYNLTETIRKFESTIFEKEIQKSLHKLLDYDLEYFYTAFHRELQGNLINEVILKTDTTDKNIHERMEEIYTIEVVKEKLNFMINESLKRFQ